MALLLTNNRQIPDHSIMDHFNKQTYLGNRYIYTTAQTISGTSETALLLISNPSANAVTVPSTSMFLDVRKLTALTASHSALLNFYLNPTVSAGVQTVTMAADVSGSLNSTYFLLNGPGNVDKYYVWFSINNAGVDPAVAGRTGIKVSGATNASASTLGGAMVTAINSAAASDFTASGTSTVTITNTSNLPFTAIVDGTAATHFTFALTSVGQGTSETPVNLRPSNPNTSVMSICLSPTVSANGTLISYMMSASQTPNSSDLLIVLDPGQTLLVTVTVSNASDKVATELSWYEL